MFRSQAETERKSWTRPYVLTFAALAFLWAIENFVIQASAFEIRPVTTHPGTYQTLRFGMNLLTATAMLLVFSRLFLVLVMIVDAFLAAVIVAYNGYFHHALSVYYGVKTLREALMVASVIWEIVPGPVWMLLAAGLGIKLVLVFKITPQPARFRWRGATACALAVAGCITMLQYSSFYFRNIPITRVNRAVYAYGYLSSWTAEFFVSPDTRDVTRELVELQKDVPDRLSATEPAWPFTNNVVMVQMESLGWTVLNYKANGQEVTPYLNSLANEGRVFKIQVYHSIGSEDMDYAAMSGGKPSKRMASYLAPDIPYTNALPRFMQHHGFESLAIHGANGDFFNRRSNFERMGFSDFWFQEEFHGHLTRSGQNVRTSYWGVRDDELFKLSSDKMRKATRPQFHFIITLDSHVPFDLITDDEKQIFPHSRDWRENYFNSVNWLDGVLKQYVEGLPAGTLVILYGDHPSGVEYGDFHSARNGVREYVPCIVHVCKSPITQPASSPTELPDDLRIHDVLGCLRHQIAAQYAEVQIAGCDNSVKP